MLLAAFVLAQGGSAPSPVLLPLVRKGSQRVATLRVGGRAVRLWLVGGIDAENLFVDQGRGLPEPSGAVRWVQQEGTTADGSRIVGYQGAFDLPKGKGRTRFLVRLLESDTKDPAFGKVRDRLQVTEVPIPPDLTPGRVAPSLTSRTLSGKPLRFPTAFRGKLVLLDVWATWCGPCRAEIPYMKEAYARFRKRGFEIASFSIDDPGMQGQVATFTKAVGETWTEAFEGHGWQSPICQRYAIQSIPFMLLVDGSTGRIVAAGDHLRGSEMAPTIARALAGKGR